MLSGIADYLFIDYCLKYAFCENHLESYKPRAHTWINMTTSDFFRPFKTKQVIDYNLICITPNQMFWATSYVFLDDESKVINENTLGTWGAIMKWIL